MLGYAGNEGQRSNFRQRLSMTPTNETIRSQAVLLLQCDIPQELTIAQYRATRQKPVPRRKRARGRLHRRRSG
jgi:hypothetical protein